MPRGSAYAALLGMAVAVAGCSPVSQPSSAAMTAEEVQALLRDSTGFFRYDNGTMVEHIGPTNRVFLWDTGNAAVTTGNVTITGPAGKVILCFRYRTGSRTLDGKPREDRGYCWSAAEYLAEPQALVRGDVFGLSDGTPPVSPLPADAANMAELLQLSGQPAITPRDIRR